MFEISEVQNKICVTNKMSLLSQKQKGILNYYKILILKSIINNMAAAKYYTMSEKS